MEEQKEEKRGQVGQKKEEAFPFFLYECILHTPTWLSLHTQLRRFQQSFILSFISSTFQ